MRESLAKCVSLTPKCVSITPNALDLVTLPVIVDADTTIGSLFRNDPETMRINKSN